MPEPRDPPMRRTLRLLFLTVEINLILWIAALGTVFAAGEHGQGVKGIIVAGVVFAVLVQHWAYYAVYQRAKQMG